ncbi:hypothetical protein SC206_00855 [Rouxiella sp. T17]|uniref:hypothetical protein n=1 Tax=Rouxiella sp. T17 TaxID=3085684 RepID=UPI002FC79FFE
MTNIGNCLTSNFTQSLRGMEASNVQSEAKINDLCTHLVKVSIAANKYCKDVDNARNLSVKGSIDAVINLSANIIDSKAKINRRIFKLGMQPLEARSAKKEKRIEKNIKHLEQKINKSEKLVSKLDTSHITHVAGYAKTSFKDFKTSKTNFRDFIDSVRPRATTQHNSPTYTRLASPVNQQDNPPVYVHFAPPAYEQAMKQPLLYNI